MFRPQPSSEPPEPLLSSKAYRLQTPFGFVPSKTESGTFPLGAGAGGGQVSAAPP
jgi:hypothetical protein